MEDLFLRDRSYFNQAKIDLFLETEVTKIHWQDKYFTYRSSTNQPKSISYDYLVLATGLRPRKLPSSLPGSNLRNIFYLRSFEDANHLVSKYLDAYSNYRSFILYRCSPSTNDEKYCYHWRFVYCIGIMWMVNNRFRGEKKCFGGHAFRHSYAT